MNVCVLEHKLEHTNNRHVKTAPPAVQERLWSWWH